MNSNNLEKSRREFIRLTSLGLAGAMLVPGFKGFSKNTGLQQKRMGIALVGLGYYSTDILAPALLETKNTYLAGIVTGSPEKAKSWALKYNIPARNIYNYQNFDEIASNPDIGIVYIVLPNSMHKEFTIRAARAGKHVICEKPMALNAAECRDMIAACEQNKVGLSIGYRMHYEPFTQEVIRIGREKDFGEILQISCGAAFRSNSYDHWKWNKDLGGGAMMDMGVYPLQAARYVTGQEPVSVTAQTHITRPQAKNRAEEVVTFQLVFPGGAVANLESGFHANFNYLKVYAENGWFELDPFSGYGGIRGRSSRGEFNFPNINQQAQQMDEDAASFATGERPRVSGEEGLRDMLVVDAIYESIQTGKKTDINSHFYLKI
jgi:glucose-fructose oxidoreductase